MLVYPGPQSGHPLIPPSPPPPPHFPAKMFKGFRDRGLYLGTPPCRGALEGGEPPLPPLLQGTQPTPSHCPLTPSARLNGICNRQ